MDGLEDKLKRLEREIAVKNAYLSIQFSFPKGSKLPEDVKQQVVSELKNACANLAADVEERESDKKDLTTERLNDEEIRILRQIVESVKSRTSVTSAPTPVADPKYAAPIIQAIPQESAAPKVPAAKKVFDAGQDGVKTATLLTTEGLDMASRSKINSGEEVYVTSIRADGFAQCSVKRTGASIRIPAEDLEFTTK